MSWTVDNPPAVARNWSDEEKRRCVVAANHVLEETGSEEQAIYACIHAAGRSEKVKMDEVKAEESERERLYRAKEARAKRYGIAPKEGTPLTPPADYPQDEEQYGDPVNYKYPIDEEHISAALVYFNQSEHRQQGRYTPEEWAIIGKRIARAASRLLDAKYEYRDGNVVRVDEEKSYAVKVLDETENILHIGGWGIIFGRRDLQGDTFAPDVDIGLSMLPIPQRPVFYDHGLHPVVGVVKLGDVKRVEKRPEGYWVEAELDRHQRYVRDLEVLLAAGVLGWSSGAVAHLVDRDSSVIRRWPVYEFSLTPTPAEPGTLGVQVLKSLASATGIELPEDVADTSVAVSEAPEDQAAEEAAIQSNGGDKMSQDEQIVVPSADEIAAKVYERLAAEPTAVKGLAATGNAGKPDRVEAFKAWLRLGDAAPPAIKADLEQGTPGLGGFLVPEEWQRELIMGLTVGSLIRQADARVIQVNTDRIHLPTLTFGSAAAIVNEKSAYPDRGPAATGEVVFTPFKLGWTCKVTEELVMNPLFDIWNQVLLPDYTQAFAAAENSYFTVGTGTGEPQGVVTGATVGVTTASSTAITADEIIALYHSLNYLYRPNAVWMMNDATAMLVRQMKDNTGQYLWQPGLQDSQPDRLLGRPVITNNWMPTVAAGARVILFGDFRYYYITEREGLTVDRNPYLYMASGYVAFFGRMYVDGRIVLPDAFRVLRMKP